MENYQQWFQLLAGWSTWVTGEWLSPVQNLLSTICQSPRVCLPMPERNNIVSDSLCLLNLTCVAFISKVYCCWGNLRNAVSRFLIFAIQDRIWKLANRKYSTIMLLWNHSLLWVCDPLNYFSLKSTAMGVVYGYGCCSWWRVERRERLRVRATAKLSKVLVCEDHKYIFRNTRRWRLLSLLELSSQRVHDVRQNPCR